MSRDLDSIIDEALLEKPPTLGVKLSEIRDMIKEDLTDVLQGESVNIGGLEYEQRVYETLLAANIEGLDLGEKPAAGFSSAGSGDLEATYMGKPFNIEIKASINDQMGGGSVKYVRETQELIPSKKLAAGTETDDLQQILLAVKEKTPAVDAYLDALSQIEPVEYHQRNTGIPFVASVEARSQLKQSGHHKAINGKIRLSERYITNLYNAKNVYYIQVGGAGLFYMGKDILGLGVPKFSGEVNVEIRLGFAGTKIFFKTEPEPTSARRAELRCIGRMKTKSRSEFSLDDPEAVARLFNK